MAGDKNIGEISWEAPERIQLWDDKSLKLDMDSRHGKERVNCEGTSKKKTVFGITWNSGA